MSDQLKSFILLMVFGVITCIIFGVIFFGVNVFNLKSPLFQFVSFGIIGSVSFALFQFDRYRDAAFVSILLFLIIFLVTGGRFLFTHFLYFLGVVISILLFSTLIYQKLEHLKYIRPLVLSGIFSISFVVITLILALIYYPGIDKINLFRNMPVGFLIGLGLGVGFELSEIIAPRIKK